MNGRVNYPLKKALVLMDNNNIIDMADDIQKFCVSKVTMEVASYGAKVCIDSWMNILS